MTGESVSFGIAGEWAAFHKRHSRFAAVWPRLEQLLRGAYVRDFAPAEPVERFLFLFGRVTADNFNEILLLCGNGYGLGALKLLRSMFELAVTTRYLGSQADQLDRFLDFHWVAMHKQLVVARDVFGASHVPKEWADEIEAGFREVKDKFIETECRDCGTTRPSFRWSTLDLVSMARKFEEFKALIVPAYYLPLLEAHANLSILSSQVEAEGDSGLAFVDGPQREKADLALRAAHQTFLVLTGFLVERLRFVDMAQLVVDCKRDFEAVWLSAATQDSAAPDGSAPNSANSAPRESE